MPAQPKRRSIMPSRLDILPLSSIAPNRIPRPLLPTLAVLLLAFVPSPVSSEPLFEAAQSYTAGDWPFSVASGDLDSDGKPDLVVANDLTNDVSVFMGKGD